MIIDWDLYHAIVQVFYCANTTKAVRNLLKLPVKDPLISFCLTAEGLKHTALQWNSIATAHRHDAVEIPFNGRYRPITVTRLWEYKMVRSWEKTNSQRLFPTNWHNHACWSFYTDGWGLLHRVARHIESESVQYVSNVFAAIFALYLTVNLIH